MKHRAHDFGIFYHFLKTHKKVEDFMFEFNWAVKNPEAYPQTFVSLANWWNDKGFLTKKQARLAVVLFFEMGRNNK